jgi:hypothetical protein
MKTNTKTRQRLSVAYSNEKPTLKTRQRISVAYSDENQH